jgi:CAAX protease family protein
MTSTAFQSDLHRQNGVRSLGIERPKVPAQIAPEGVVVVVGIAGWEEIVFRGYLIKNLAEGLYSNTIGARWATVIAILIPSVLFGLAHVSNANATMLSTVNTMIFGVVFGARMC